MNISNEEIVNLTAAAALTPGRPHVSTLMRWATHGVRGTRLETIKVGGRRFTSREAILRFVAALNATIQPSLDDQRCKQIETADQELTKLGL